MNQINFSNGQYISNQNRAQSTLDKIVKNLTDSYMVFSAAVLCIPCGYEIITSGKDLVEFLFE